MLEANTIIKILIAVCLLSGSLFGEPTPRGTPRDPWEVLCRDSSERYQRHRDPASAFVLPEVTRGAVVPTVSSLSPSTGPIGGGTAVTITGFNFISGATVKFSNTSATNVVVVNGATITCNSPAKTTGIWDVTVTTSNGTSIVTPADQFVYGTAGRILFFGGYQDAGNQSTQMLLSGSVGCYTSFQVANGASWSSLEPTQGNYNWAPLDAIVSFCQTNNIIWKASIIQLAGSNTQTNSLVPQYIYSLSNAHKLQALKNFLQAMGNRYPSSVLPYLTALNEPSGGAGIMDGALGSTGTTGYDWAINLLQIFRTYFPRTKLGVNDYIGGSDISDGYAQYKTICSLMSQHGVIDWIGLESYWLETTPNPDIIRGLNTYAAMASPYMPILITELTLGFIDENAKLARWQDLLQNVYVKHPAVVAIQGPWNWNKYRANIATAGSELNTCWIIDDTVSPAVPTPTLMWLRGYLPGVLSLKPSGK